MAITRRQIAIALLVAAFLAGAGYAALSGAISVTSIRLWLESLGPATAKGHAWLAGKLGENGPQREDITTYCEHLDLDDYVSFGGRG